MEIAPRRNFYATNAADINKLSFKLPVNFYLGAFTAYTRPLFWNGQLFRLLKGVSEFALDFFYSLTTCAYVCFSFICFGLWYCRYNHFLFWQLSGSFSCVDGMKNHCKEIRWTKSYIYWCFGFTWAIIFANIRIENTKNARGYLCM